MPVIPTAEMRTAKRQEARWGHGVSERGSGDSPSLPPAPRDNSAHHRAQEEVVHLFERGTALRPDLETRGKVPEQWERQAGPGSRSPSTMD